MSFSADGTVLAISAQNNDGNGDNSGHIRVFQLDGSSWIQVGQDIDGEAEGDNSGEMRTVSLSADGSVIAIGAPGHDGNGENSGRVRVFQLDGSSWIQVGQDLDGEAAYDRISSVSLSADGTWCRWP